LTLTVNNGVLVSTMQTPLRFKVPFDETDCEGLVFFGNYFRLAHRTLEAWLPTKGIPWEEWFKNPTYGCPLRHAEAEFLRPLFAGDDYTVDVKVREIGESSIHFDMKFETLAGELVATVSTSHVFIDRKMKKKSAVPDSIRQRLK
jgi:1,4-dihydroxy-2-naphthoyl-CoA hydrolase